MTVSAESIVSGGDSSPRSAPEGRVYRFSSPHRMISYGLSWSPVTEAIDDIRRPKICCAMATSSATESGTTSSAMTCLSRPSEVGGSFLGCIRSPARLSTGPVAPSPSWLDLCRSGKARQCTARLEPKRVVPGASGDQHGSMASELVEHYGVDLVEDTRLSRSPHGRLEFLRTQELIRRLVPVARARILDIGGGTGVHAAWLAADGHAVNVVDLVPRHVDAAAAREGVTAEVGDARQLSASDESVDVALLLGPLYHLVEPAERACALAEARRVLRPGGLLVVAAVSRYMSLLEVGSEGRLTAEMEPSVASVIATGRYDGHAGFVDAHFHTADELHAAMTDARVRDGAVFGGEGPAWPAPDPAGLQEFEARVEAALRCARIVERDPLMINTSAHLLGVGRK